MCGNECSLNEKATDLAAEMGIVYWEASEGWLHRLINWHGLAFKTICDESASVSPEMVQQWHQETLPRLLEQLSPFDVYNVDKTGLFYQCLPNKMFTFHGQTASRAVKESKQRLTLLFGVNMDGSDKLQPLVIGKSAQPRCFKGVQSLPVVYKSNTKAWMTGKVWAEWLQAFD